MTKILLLCPLPPRAGDPFRPAHIAVLPPAAPPDFVRRREISFYTDAAAAATRSDIRTATGLGGAGSAAFGTCPPCTCMSTSSSPEESLPLRSQRPIRSEGLNSQVGHVSDCKRPTITFRALFQIKHFIGWSAGRKLEASKTSWSSCAGCGRGHRHMLKASRLIGGGRGTHTASFPRSKVVVTYGV